MNRRSITKQILLLAMAMGFNYSLANAAGSIANDKDGAPLWSYLGAESPNMPILYHTKGEVEKTASLGIEYQKGKAALQEELGNLFWKQYDGDCDSVHLKVFYCILFDENLNMEEIRFQKVGLVNKIIEEMERCGYFEILESELSKTKGKWERKDKEETAHSAYVYFGWVNL